MKKGVIFDNEWVIVRNDWDKVARRVSEMFAVRQMTGKEYKTFLKGEPIGETNRLYLHNTGRVDPREFWISVLEDYGIPPTDKNVAGISTTFEGLTTGEDEKVINLIKRLKEAEVELYMLSNATVEIAKGNRERNDYFSLFDGVFYSFEIGHRKPEPEAFRVALKRSGLQASELVFVDDKPKNVEGAIDGGIEGIVYKIGQPFPILECKLREKGLEF